MSRENLKETIETTQNAQSTSRHAADVIHYRHYCNSFGTVVKQADSFWSKLFSSSKSFLSPFFLLSPSVSGQTKHSSHCPANNSGDGSSHSVSSSLFFDCICPLQCEQHQTTQHTDRPLHSSGNHFTGSTTYTTV